VKTVRRDSTGANRGNGDAQELLCSLRFLLFKSECDGDTDFKFLARDTWPPYVDKRRMRVAGKLDLCAAGARRCGDCLVQRRGRGKLRALKTENGPSYE